MGSKPVEDLIEASSGVHFSGFHMDGSVSELEQPTASTTEDVPKQPFVIGMFGSRKHDLVFTKKSFAQRLFLFFEKFVSQMAKYSMVWILKFVVTIMLDILFKFSNN